jgi:carbonic anhydrase/acetyltransferase-like protein (isoleucine patch superfamily)
MTAGARNSIRPNPHGDWPQIDSNAYINLTAQIIGNVRIGPHVYIGPNAVIRADETDDKGEEVGWNARLAQQQYMRL